MTKRMRRQMRRKEFLIFVPPIERNYTVPAPDENKCKIDDLAHATEQKKSMKLVFMHCDVQWTSEMATWHPTSLH